MNFFLHMSLVVALDYGVFLYWYALANRYRVLNFHETGFLPARYIVSGLVAGAFIYWLYVILVAACGYFSRRYRHPRWWMLWISAGFITSLQIANITIQQGAPPLDLEVTLGLVAHLQLVHLIMFVIADRAAKHPFRIFAPGIGSGLIFMGLWLFWIWYSFAVKPEGTPAPHVGSDLERYVLAMILIVLMWIALIYLWGLHLPGLRPTRVMIEPFAITVRDLLNGFYSAWGLYYLTIPAVHYLARGYVTAHSNFFGAFLPAIVVVVIWSLVVMWPIIWLAHPETFKIKIKFPYAMFQR